MARVTKAGIGGAVKVAVVPASGDPVYKTIEEILDADRTRGSKAKDTQIKEIIMGDNLEHPYGTFTLNVEVKYIFTRGAT